MNTIDYLLHIHTLPEDLAIVMDKPNVPLCNTAKLYAKIIEDKYLWNVWLIDEYEELWIEINSIDDKGEAKFETLKIDAGTYTKIECEPYTVLRDHKS